MPNDQNEPAKSKPSLAEEPPMSDLRGASERLKAKIAEARTRGDLRLDSTLGNPNWDKNAADGHLDVPDDDDDGWPHSPAKANKTSPP